MKADFREIIKNWRKQTWFMTTNPPTYPVIKPADQLKSDLLNCLIRYDQETQLEALTSVVKKQFPLTWRVYRLHIIRNRKQASMVT